MHFEKSGLVPEGSEHESYLLYAQARVLFDEGKYAEAAAQFVSLPMFIDSALESFNDVHIKFFIWFLLCLR